MHKNTKALIAIVWLGLILGVLAQNKLYGCIGQITPVKYLSAYYILPLSKWFNNHTTFPALGSAITTRNVTNVTFCTIDDQGSNYNYNMTVFIYFRHKSQRHVAGVYLHCYITIYITRYII